jgi:hypothetical protein
MSHAKHGVQLGQSRMKHDETTLAAGYSAMGSFNLCQLVRQRLDFGWGFLLSFCVYCLLETQLLFHR